MTRRPSGFDLFFLALTFSVTAFPGAAETSTLEEESEGNPFMHFTEVDQFVRYRMKIHDQIRNSPYSAQSENSLKQELDKLES